MTNAFDQRICIIGGGPAGISAGHYLEQAGYHNYTILEADDRVGGKTYSPHPRGKSIEMGSIMGVPSYDTMDELDQAAGVDHIGPGGLDKYDYRRPDGRLYHPIGGANMWKGIRILFQLKKFEHILQTRYPGYDVNGHRTLYPDLALPFRDFLAMHGLSALEFLYQLPFTSFGYGYFDVVPAAYVLKYLDIPTARSFAAADLWTWQDGTQSVFVALNETLEHPARLNSPVTAVRRLDDVVEVTTPEGTSAYDTLIVTSPLDRFVDYADADGDETAYFSRILHNDYITHAVMLRNPPDRSAFVPGNMVPGRLGHIMVFYNRYPGERDQPIVTYALRNYPGRPTLSVPETRRRVLGDLESWGLSVKDVIDEQDWYYFPHLSSKDYAAGWYQKVEAMQGRRHTYYAGEVMSFGDMDETTHYSKDLVARFFGPSAAETPGAPQARETSSS